MLFKPGKIFFLALFLCASHAAFSQYVYHYSANATRGCFITAGYGYGTSSWNSKLKSTNLYDTDGAIIKSGDIKFKTKTATQGYDINVLAPFSKIMFGFGFNFEDNAMDKIKILNPSADAGVIAFDQNFRFDKLYFLAEAPFNDELKSNFSIAVQARLGYYNYTGVDRENFFGEEGWSNTIFAGAGLVASYKLFPHVFVYLHPNFQYNNFNYKGKSNSTEIKHSIFSFSAIAGIRIDAAGR